MWIHLTVYHLRYLNGLYFEKRKKKIFFNVKLYIHIYRYKRTTPQYRGNVQTLKVLSVKQSHDYLWSCQLPVKDAGVYM